MGSNGPTEYEPGVLIAEPRCSSAEEVTQSQSQSTTRSPFWTYISYEVRAFLALLIGATSSVVYTALEQRVLSVAHWGH
jgi:hypothetical protein